MGKVIWSTIGILLAIILVVGGLNYIGAWGSKAAEVVSPQNVQKQHEVVIDHYNSMIAAAGNACTVQQSAAKEKTSKTPVIVEDPTLAYAATFRRIVSTYNSSVDNLFKAGIVAPPGYPKSVDVNSIDTTDWCMVEGQILNMRN